jgi:hypothetical protein
MHSAVGILTSDAQCVSICCSDAYVLKICVLEIDMRTTLDLEEDVLMAAKEIARQQGVPVGKVVSDLVRQAMTHRPVGARRQGIPLFPIQPNAGVVTPELVNQLRDEAP